MVTRDTYRYSAHRRNSCLRGQSDEPSDGPRRVIRAFEKVDQIDVELWEYALVKKELDRAVQEAIRLESSRDYETRWKSLSRRAAEILLCPLEIALAHDLCPLGEIGTDHATEFVRRAEDRVHAFAGEAFLHLG